MAFLKTFVNFFTTIKKNICSPKYFVQPRLLKIQTYMTVAIQILLEVMITRSYIYKKGSSLRVIENLSRRNFRGRRFVSCGNG